MINKEQIAKAVEVLKKGGVVAHATETCYGFTCDALNADAIERIYAVKQMKRSKPISIMMSSLKEAQQYGKFSQFAAALGKKYWPGPLTIVVPRASSLLSFINPGIDSVGIRVPDHSLSLALLRAFGGPLTTTSANISGKPPPYSAQDITAQFFGEIFKPDFILDSGIIDINPPSTIIDCTYEKAKILRQGKIQISVDRV